MADQCRNCGIYLDVLYNNIKLEHNCVIAIVFKAKIKMAWQFRQLTSHLMEPERICQLESGKR